MDILNSVIKHALGGTGSRIVFETVVVCTPGTDLASQESSAFPNTANLASQFSVVSFVVFFFFFKLVQMRLQAQCWQAFLLFFLGLM